MKRELPDRFELDDDPARVDLDELHRFLSFEAYGAKGFVLAFDAADLQRNIDDEISPGGMIGDVPEQGIESIRRLKSISAEKGPTHPDGPRGRPSPSRAPCSGRSHPGWRCPSRSNGPSRHTCSR